VSSVQAQRRLKEGDMLEAENDMKYGQGEEVLGARKRKEFQIREG
jgi:hypothetical protein